MRAPDTTKRIIVGITGASGAVYGVRLLELLRATGQVETHLVVSTAGWMTLTHELGLSRSAVEAKADVVHGLKEVGACIASGSFKADGMVIAPCSMKTLAAVAHGMADNLLTRSADVMLKERRKLLLLVRETPFNLAHLRNMTAVTEMGGLICPPLPAFYQKPQSIADLVDHSLARVFDWLDLPHAIAPAWSGLKSAHE